MNPSTNHFTWIGGRRRSSSSRESDFIKFAFDIQISYLKY